MILGLDPGLANCGYALLKDKKIVLSGTWNTAVDHDMPGSEDLYSRCLVLTQRIGELIRDNKELGMIATETFVGRSPSASTIKTSMAIGWIQATATYGLGKPIIQFDPQQWRRILGMEKSASKKDVQEFVFKELKHQCITEHEADAICIALAGGKHV